jgi:hypothetical protein
MQELRLCRYAEEAASTGWRRTTWRGERGGEVLRKKDGEGVTPHMVSIIIVNYNTPNLVHDCLVSIEKMLTIPYEIIVVESGTDHPTDSTDLDRFHCLHIPTTKRRGFGQANNLGAAKAKGEFLWFLNSDTVIPNHRINQLFPLFNHHKQIGILSPVLYNDHALQVMQPDFYASFQSFRTLLTRKVRPTINWKNSALPEMIPVDVVVGASLIIRRNLFQKIGGFDENIFMYMEDDDLCYRSFKAGYLTAIATQAHLVHLQGKSLKKNRTRKSLYYRSQNYFWQKHYGVGAALLMRGIRLPFRLVKSL